MCVCSSVIPILKGTPSTKYHKIFVNLFRRLSVKDSTLSLPNKADDTKKQYEYGAMHNK